MAAYSGSLGEGARHVIENIKTYNLDKPSSEDDELIYWSQFAQPLNELFLKEETIDIFDQFGEHSTGVEDEIKQYNKQVERFIARIAKIQIATTALFEKQLNFIQSMPKQIDFNQIHRAAMQCEPAFEMMHTELNKVATSVQTKKNQLKSDLPTQAVVKKTDSLVKEQAKIQEKAE